MQLGAAPAAAAAAAAAAACLRLSLLLLLIPNSTTCLPPYHHHHRPPALPHLPDNKHRLDAIRFLNASLKQREIELRSSGGSMVDAEVVTTIQKLAKQRRDSIESYQKGALYVVDVDADLDIDVRGLGADAASGRNSLRVASHHPPTHPLPQPQRNHPSPGGRDDLVAKEEAELALLEGYLPAQLPEEELRAIVAAAVAEAGATSQKQMGAVMKLVQGRTAGRADNKMVSTLVKAALAG